MPVIAHPGPIGCHQLPPLPPGIRGSATPHAYINDSEFAPDPLPADAIEPKLTTLWNELDQDLRQR